MEISERISCNNVCAQFLAVRLFYPVCCRSVFVASQSVPIVHLLSSCCMNSDDPQSPIILINYYWRSTLSFVGIKHILYSIGILGVQYESINHPTQIMVWWYIRVSVYSNVFIGLWIVYYHWDGEDISDRLI